MKFINIGYGNMVAVDRIVTDVTCGRKTRAVIVTDSEHVILAAIQTETIANRLESGELSLEDEEPEDEA